MIKLGKNDSREQGFGLIDTLIATVLLGIAVVAMLAGFTYASAGARENRERIQATMLMQETMENLKQNDGVATINLALMVPSDGDLVGTASTTNALYTITQNNVTYTVTVTAAPANSLTKLQAVTLTVAWTEVGVDRSMTMVEYIYLK
jgi:type II secretory pathway pseudopilin PulG